QRELERLGVRFSWETEAFGIERATNGKLHSLGTSMAGSLEADEFVLCAGSWSSEFAGKLGLRIPIQAGKGYSLTLPKPRQLPEICSICTEARLAVTPMDGALRVGETMEIAGLNEDINPK